MSSSQKNSFLYRFVIPKLKFGVTSGVATAVDYALYTFLHDYFDMVPSTANIISQSTGILVNFVLQKAFIFELKRKLGITFLISLSFSLIGLLLGTTIVTFLSGFDTLIGHSFKWLHLPKIIAIGIVFFFNFYTKRFAFERKIPGSSLKQDG